MVVNKNGHTVAHFELILILGDVKIDPTFESKTVIQSEQCFVIS